MSDERRFVEKVMHATDKFRMVFGPADQGDVDSPIVHRHDAIEDESDEVLSHIEEHTDTAGHHYATRKAQELT